MNESVDRRVNVKVNQLVETVKIESELELYEEVGELDFSIFHHLLDREEVLSETLGMIRAMVEVMAMAMEANIRAPQTARSTVTVATVSTGARINTSRPRASTNS